MRYDAEQKDRLYRLQARIDAKLEQVRDMVGPDLADVAPEDLQPIARARLQSLGPVERTTLQIKAAAAHAELSNLLDEMNRHLVDIADEMRKTSQYSRAVSAYGAARGR